MQNKNKDESKTAKFYIKTLTDLVSVNQCEKMYEQFPLF